MVFIMKDMLLIQSKDPFTLSVSVCCVMLFPLPDSYAYSYSDSYSDIMQKGSTGTNSNGHSDAKLL